MAILTPYPLQEEAIEKGLKVNTILALETGVGKTLVAIETVKRLQENYQSVERKVKQRIFYPKLIICPYKATHQWKRAIEEQIPNAIVGIMTREHSVDNWKQALKIDMWIITHYHTFHNVKTYKYLRDKSFFAIVLDEAHRIKNYNGKWSARIAYLKAYRKLALSASLRPVTEEERKAGMIVPLKSPAGMFNILKFLYPNKYKSYWVFVGKYCDTKVSRFSDNPEILGGRKETEQELISELKPFFLHFKKSDMREMPPLIKQVVELKMEKRQQKLYDKINNAKDMIVWPDDPIEQPMVLKSKLAILTKLQQIAQHPILIEEATKLAKKESAKMLWVAEYIEDNPNEHIIIFTKYRKTAELLAEKHSDIPPIIGGNKDVKYPTLQDRIVVGTIASMNEALDLPWIKTGIFFGANWNRIDMQQSSERIYRINIIEPKHLYYLQAINTVDQKIWEAIHNGWSVERLIDEVF